MPKLLPKVNSDYIEPLAKALGRFLFKKHSQDGIKAIPFTSPGHLASFPPQAPRTFPTFTPGPFTQAGLCLTCL